MEKYKKARLCDSNGTVGAQWYVFFSYLNPETNKYDRFKIIISKKIKTKTDRYVRAKTIINEINDKLFNGWNPYDQNLSKIITISDAIEHFLSIKKETIRYRSYHTYKNCATKFLKYLKENRKLQITVHSFTYKDAISFMDYTKHKLNVKNRTYNNYRKFLINLFNFFIERELILVNHFKRIKKLLEEQAEIIRLEPFELDIIKTYLPKDDYPLFICTQMVFYCLIRPAELMRLRVKDIDHVRGFINVKGFVRNLEDGRVEIFLEGNNEDVDKAIELCKKGPKQSQIKGIDIRPEKFQDFKTFKILHI